MAGELDSLVIRLAAETADAQRNVARMERSVDRFSKSSQRSLTKVDKSFNRTSALAAKMGNRLMAAFGTTLIVAWVDQVARATNAMADMADSVGFTTDKFQELHTLAAQQGLDANKLEASMRRFAVAMGEVRGQAGGFYEFLKRHLPTVAAQLSATKDQAGALAVLESAFERLHDPAQRAALANQAFSRQGLQLGSILSQTGSQIDEATAAAKRYETVIGADTIKASREMQKEVDLLTLSFKKLSTEGIGAAFKAAKDWKGTLKGVLDFISLGGVVTKKMTDPHSDDEARATAHASRIAGFAAKGMQAAMNEQPPLEWKVKLKPQNDPSAFKTTVSEGDPFQGLYENALSQHEAFIAQVKDSYSEVAQVIGEGLTAPLKDAFSGNLQDTKTYLRNLIQGLANAVIQATLLKPIIDAIKNSLAGSSAGGSGLGSLLGNLFGGFRAGGGSVQPGRAYVVGEKGPEIMVPNTAGAITPNSQIGGGGGQSVVYNINAAGAEVGVEQRIYTVLANLERNRPTAPQQMAGYMGRYPLRGRAA